MQVFYSQMCDLIKLGLNGRVFQCPPARGALFSSIRQKSNLVGVFDSTVAERLQNRLHPNKPTCQNQLSLLLCFFGILAYEITNILKAKRNSFVLKQIAKRAHF